MRICLILLVMSLVSPVLALATAPVDADTDVILVLSLPGMDAHESVTQAGGRIVGPFETPVGLLASGEMPKLAIALRRGGLWVFDGAALAAICGVRL